MKNITRIANSCKAKHLLSNNACIATNSRSCCYTANNFTFVNALSPLKLHTHKPTSLIRIQARSSSSSSSSSSDKKDDDNVGWTEGLSDIDIEKQLLKIKRTMGSYYSKGDYQGKSFVITVCYSCIILAITTFLLINVPTLVRK